MDIQILTKSLLNLLPFFSSVVAFSKIENAEISSVPGGRNGYAESKNTQIPIGSGTLMRCFIKTLIYGSTKGVSSEGPNHIKGTFPMPVVTNLTRPFKETSESPVNNVHESH